MQYTAKEKLINKWAKKIFATKDYLQHFQCYWPWKWFTTNIQVDGFLNPFFLVQNENNGLVWALI